jgi:predicted transcriptional regulator
MPSERDARRGAILSTLLVLHRGEGRGNEKILRGERRPNRIDALTEANRNDYLRLDLRGRGRFVMAKNVSVYLDEKELRTLDRLAKSERRSRSGMVGEIIRRYAGLLRMDAIADRPLVRTFSLARLDEFLKEDAKISDADLAAVRNLRRRRQRR